MRLARICPCLSAFFAIIVGCRDYALTPEYYECEPAWIQEIETAHPKGDAYQAALDGLVEKGVPGAIMLIKTPEDGLWVGASGKSDLFLNTDIRVCNKSRLASVTKMFISTLLLMLAEEGKVDLDDPLGDYVPGAVCKNIANCEKATIRQALDNTAGLPSYQDADNYRYWLDYYNYPDEPETREDLLATCYSRDAPFAPGEDYSYTNVGYVLMSYVIDAITDRNHEDVIQERLFDRLSLDDTSYHAHGAEPEGVIRGYQDRYGDGVFEDCSHMSKEAHFTAGGIISTVYDAARFIEALERGELINSDSLEEMKTGSKLNKDDVYGLGIHIRETVYGRVIGHPGGLDGYNTTLNHFPESGVTFAFFANRESDSTFKALSDFKSFSSENPTPEIFQTIFE